MNYIRNYISKTIISFRHAFRGIAYVLVRNPSANIPNYYLFTAFVLVLSFYFRISYLELFVLIFMALFVICTEMLNTAMEEVVNLIKKEHSAEGKIIKDVSAGMVALATIAYVGLAVVIFAYHLSVI